MLAAHLSERPQPIDELRPDTPAPLGALVMKCLEKDANARPRSAADVLHALENVTSGSALPAVPPILLGGRGMFWKALALYAAAFIGVAVVARAAIVAIGLPDWVFPGALVVMALGLPVILFTGYVRRTAQRVAAAPPTLTPRGTLVPSVTQGTLAALAAKAGPHVSWRRTWLGGALAVGAFAVLIGGFMLLRALGIGPAGSLLAAGKLATRDRLIVTDFRVRGADSALGGVVSEAVRAQLGQSQVVTILSPANVAAALRRMQRPPTTRVDLTLAREIAEREGAKAVVDGDVTPLGAGYVLTLRLVTADSGGELASFHGTADAPKDLLPTLDKLARSLRGRMGESLRSVQSAPPLEQVTTASLDALKKYAEGTRATDVEGDYAKAVRLLEEAVVLDTGFAEAWRKLGVVYGNTRMSRARQDSALTHAYRFRERLTELERLRTTAEYFATGPGRDRARAIVAEEEILRRFPNTSGIGNNLGLDVASRGEHARAETLFRHDIALDSFNFQAQTNLSRTQLNLGKVDEAAATIAVARRRFPKNIEVDLVEPALRYTQGHADSAAASFRRIRTTDAPPRVRAMMARGMASLALREGRVAESVRLLGEARGEDMTRGAVGSPLADSVTVSQIEAWFDTQPTRAVQRLDAVLTLVPLRSLPVDDREYFRIASVYAMAGRPDRARALLRQYDADVRDTTLRRWYEPGLHRAFAEIALAEKRPRDAIDEFRRGDRRPDGPVEPVCPTCAWCPICLYVALGRAFDQAGMADSAVAMLEQYLSTPWWNRLAMVGDGLNLAAVYKRLGELYDKRGDRAKAALYDAKFVDLWKDADPDLQPKVREVRARLVRAGDTERR